MKKIISLYDFQENLVNDTRNAYKAGFRAPLLVSPTGSGKTVIFSHIAEKMQKMNKYATILTHRQELLKQSSDALHDLGVEHGLISPKFSQSFELIQIASVQTLKNRLNRTREPDLIIIDEAHHAIIGNTWGKVINFWPKARILGVTATPKRLDGRGLGKASGGFFDKLILGPTMKDLIANKRLSTYKLYAPHMDDLDMTGVKMVAGDYVKSQMAERVDKPTITGNAVDHYLKICPGVPTIVFCASVAHAYHVAEQFKSAGFTAKCIEGTMADGERKTAIRDLGNGRLDILTACEIISEGTDVPVVGCGILLRPTESLTLYKQQVGRIFRYQEGKTAYILDCVGNWKKHGMPDDEYPWELDPPIRRRKKKKAEDDLPDINTCQCLKCYMVFKRGPAKCPHCGADIAKNERVIKQVEGELEEITQEMYIKKQNRREQGRAQSLEDLLAVAKSRGYKAQWAHYVFNSRKNRR